MNNELSSELMDNHLCLKYKNRIILQHSPQRPCIELGHNIEKFRMHPRYISNYKINNQLQNRIKLQNVVKKSQPAGICLEFDGLIRLSIQIVNDQIEILPELIGRALEIQPSINHFTIHLPAHADEAIYGCGEQFSYLNLRGRKVPLWTREPGLTRNFSIYTLIANLMIGGGGSWWTTYFPQPTFVSSANYFIHIESYAFAEFDFRNRDHHSLRVNAIPSKIIINVQENAPSVLRSLTTYLGRQRPLPDWALDGVWLGIIGGLDKENFNSVPAKIERAKQSNTKIAAIWSEDWTGLRKFVAQTRLFWNWKYDPVLYRDLPQYIQKLHAEGIRFLGYNNCFLMLDGELYEYAREHGYLVKNKAGDPYLLPMFSFSAVLLDLTNPETWNWFKSLIKTHMIDIGLDGWMCDFGEYFPIDAVVHSKEEPYLHHNQYPVLWAQLNDEAVKEAGRDKGDDAIIFFSRSGNFKTTRYSPLIWAGDQIMDFMLDMGLAAAICAEISAGFIGVGQTHADIAGEYKLLWIKRTKELFMRATEFCAFTLVMRTHDAKGTSGWSFDSDQETLDHFGKFSRIHAHLKPYLHDAVQEYSTSGLPVIRHCYIHYEDDPVFHAHRPRSLQYQYLLGRDLLIAPVYLKGKTTRKLYLPKDHWIHLWSGKEYSGGWITVTAPLWNPPVFYRKQSTYISLFQKITEL